MLARDLEVPILALSQLSRAVEQRHDKRPILSDLRESGSIEQDADLVVFVYRDEYYNGEESDQQGIAELILAKHRNGPTDTVKLWFLKRYAKFADLPRPALQQRSRGERSTAMMRADDLAGAAGDRRSPRSATQCADASTGTSRAHVDGRLDLEREHTSATCPRGHAIRVERAQRDPIGVHRVSDAA